ncbi:competence/damage-inducible protein A [Patulibacter minatonensis]|uniref:competence/damage-inducible protein A n=1 Tax=Patulibacter minatonensis TaxID=298163 RepID=UPI00047AB772|nr:competence/damage-inducible protein A [Patulibacter minatonensis]
MSLPRAAVIVTGTEVLGGWVSDANGPWLAQRLGALGVQHVSTTVVGDRPEDLRAALEHTRDQGLELVVTSGGLGPTEDDLTAQVVGEFAARPIALDPELEGRIWKIIEPMSRRWKGISQDAVREANRKQALVPEGAEILEPVGTAPGLVVPPTDDDPDRPPTPTVVVLPGPPPELQPMWATAEGSPGLRAAIAGATELHESTLRLFGIPESELARTLRDARESGIAVDDFEITTCMRRGELEVVSRWSPEQEAAGLAFEAFVADRHGDVLFSPDGRTVDELVLDGLRDRGWTVSTAESCTGGLLAGRLTGWAGSSDVVEGGIVSYSNAVKVAALGVDPALLEAHGAVSAEVAAAMAAGARERLGTDVAISTTGIAGPGGGTEQKPVGTVFVAVSSGGGTLTRHLKLPGDRGRVRDMTTTAALHMTRRLLAGESDPA